ncbi:hypothetical protein SAMD00023353_1500010 [Rosellinia necatrix]|uniref:Uncharacterized protein n=1 Tax=Rosellinia necatrix TaxID=77044 RepID=A0A1S8A733_ROSNE|nr:hypothetical protein SAMD00023353_1500010 [Rosellinia necatrix]
MHKHDRTALDVLLGSGIIDRQVNEALRAERDGLLMTSALLHDGAEADKAASGERKAITTISEGSPLTPGADM